MNVLSSNAFGKTDIGGRANNEDAFAIHRDNNLLVVADGMGGHQNGEMASASACQSLAASATAAAASFDSTDAAKTWLCQALQDAHQAVVKLNSNQSGLQRWLGSVTAASTACAAVLLIWSMMTTSSNTSSGGLVKSQTKSGTLTAGVTPRMSLLAPWVVPTSSMSISVKSRSPLVMWFFRALTA